MFELNFAAKTFKHTVQYGQLKEPELTPEKKSLMSGKMERKRINSFLHIVEILYTTMPTRHFQDSQSKSIQTVIEEIPGASA